LFVIETREKSLNSCCFRFDLLEHCYTKFDKGYFAGLCHRLSVAAAVHKDQLSQWLFNEAGCLLARHVIALIPQVDSVSICL